MTKVKKSALALSAACALALTGGLLTLKTAPADALNTSDFLYYGKQLQDDVAKNFYDQVCQMFKDPGGNLTQSMPKSIGQAAASYAEGDQSIFRSFGAALDSVKYDHSEYFFVDFSALDLRILPGKSEYTVNVGPGKSSSYLRGNIGEDVNTAINNYRDALENIVHEITSNGISDTSTLEDKVEAVNNIICEGGKISYVSGSTPTGQRSLADTSYGALSGYIDSSNADAKGYADSEGYARAFQQVLYKLDPDIKCVVVSGYYVDLEEKNVRPWTWNYVADRSDNWYAVDVAHNALLNENKYLMETGENFNIDHYEERTVSAYGYEMPYPSIRTRNIEVEKYATKLDVFAGGDDSVHVSYDNKNAKQLGSGMQFGIRVMEDTTNFEWGDWMPLGSWQSGEVTDVDAIPETNSSAYTKIEIGTGAEDIYAIAVFDGAINKENIIEYTTISNGQPKLPVTTMTVFPTTGSSDIRKSLLDSTRSYNIIITYSGTLTLEESPSVALIDGEGEGGTSQEGEATPQAPTVNIQYDTSKGEIDPASIKWSGTNKLEFTFTPNNSVYSNGVCEFIPTNLTGTDSAVEAAYKIAPFRVVFRAPALNVERLFLDNRFYLDTVTDVSLANNTNLAVGNWTYEGTQTAIPVYEQSQIILEKMPVSPLEKDALKVELIDYLGAEAESHEVEFDDECVAATSVLNLALTVCGKTVTLFGDVKMTFAYPEGCKFGDEGIVYRVFSCNNTSLTECDCVPTRYGIVASVRGGGTFLVAAVKGESDRKSIVTQVNGKGSVVASTNKSVNSLQEGENVSYTITALTGFAVEYIVFNGEEFNPNGSDSGTYLCAFDYDDSKLVANNVLQVGFVASDLLADEASASLEKQAAMAMTNKQFTVDVPEPEPEEPPVITSSTKTQLIVLAVIVGLSVLVGSVLLVYCVAVKPKIIMEKEEEEARIAANRARRANRNRMQAGLMPRMNPNGPAPNRPQSGPVPQGMRNPNMPRNPNLPPRR